ncbi:zinc-binding alcohol dehydrogenase family protein [Rossellomorea vietnamensis]|uniref:Zinc-binding alcohol dehydrogenase family protein n=1 Tax=Rossellomorea vietnamensis TaxID=218284 RepID=A0A5D4M420_9BACI|nr:zinc-binding alcohol dehydrogenase family protein [Rossellomorea vietnamensis]TYR96257.1 zinc-binding alcohol dehydrogenase family protein [Rossellomorea vietnamensis]
MKAVQVTGPHQLSIVERDKPVISNNNEVLIKVKMVGICGSDIHIYHGTNPLATLPRVIGHEVTGEVEAVGEKVESIAAGDKVVLEPIEPCGDCYACRSGRGNVCSNLEVYGVHRDGGMQEYIVVPERRVHKVSDELDWKESVLIEPFTIGAQANWRGDVRAGDTVFIMGAGPIGLCCLKVAKSEGATVIISDLNENRLAFAKEWGADYTINASQANVIEAVMDITKQEGANVVIDAVCIPQTFEQSLEIVSAAGRVVVLGFDERPSSISQLPITKKEVTITGSRLQTEQFPRVIEMLNKKTIDPAGMVTQDFPLDQITEAIQLIETNPEEVRKVVISFDHQ